MISLDGNIENFMDAFRRNNLDLNSHREHLELFIKLAKHRYTTPFLKDQIVVIFDEYDS